MVAMLYLEVKSQGCAKFTAQMTSLHRSKRKSLKSFEQILHGASPKREAFAVDQGHRRAFFTTINPGN